MQTYNFLELRPRKKNIPECGIEGMELEELKNSIRTADHSEFVNEHIIGSESQFFPNQKIEIVCSRISRVFGTNLDVSQVVVVGSAKLGYGIHAKRKQNLELPAFRRFSLDSDIDLAFICPALFEMLWQELSHFSLRQARMPWDSGKLGDYLACGWLRSDLFPKGQSLRRCDDWWSMFAALSCDRSLGRRQIRGGLYFSIEQFRQYQIRGLKECKRKMEI